MKIIFIQLLITILAVQQSSSKPSLQRMMATEKPTDLPKFEEIGFKSYYIEHTEKLNWRDASNKCRALGGRLLVLQNGKEAFEVIQKLANNEYWIGQSDCVNLAKHGYNYVMRYNDCEAKLNYVCEQSNY